MAKKIILIVLLSAVFLLMQGSDQSLSQQYKSHEATYELIWRGKVPLCSGSDSCVSRNRFCPPLSSIDKQLAKPATNGIHPHSKAETDTVPQLNKSSNESRLGILEYLLKWINLVLKMS